MTLASRLVGALLFAAASIGAFLAVDAQMLLARAGDTGAAQSTTPAQPVNPKKRPTTWSVLGTANQGRTLLVSSSHKEEHCYDTVATLLDATSSRVRIRLEYVLEPDVTDDVLCYSQDIAMAPEIHRVKLGRRLTGQAITGRGFVGPEKVAAEHRNYSSEDRVVPSLLGLRSKYAKAILAGWGYRGRHLTARGPQPGVVIAMSPDPLRVSTDDADVTITTTSCKNVQPSC